MRKELIDRVENTFGAVIADVQKNPKNLREAQALIRDQTKLFREQAAAAYTASVAARKEERAAKREAKATAITEARTARDEAKAKFAAALAIKVNGNVAKKRAKKAGPVQMELPILPEPTETGEADIF